VIDDSATAGRTLYGTRDQVAADPQAREVLLRFPDLAEEFARLAHASGAGREAVELAGAGT
jgi:hypothetical protein